MTDKKLGLKDTLRLAPKIALPKKEPNVEATDRMVQKLHAEEVVNLLPPLLFRKQSLKNCNPCRKVVA